MKIYVISVRSKDSASYSEPLKFRTSDIEEVVEILDMMLKHGHTVIVEPVEEPEEDPQKEEKPSELIEIKVSVKDPGKTV